MKTKNKFKYQKPMLIVTNQKKIVNKKIIKFSLSTRQFKYFIKI